MMLVAVGVAFQGGNPTIQQGGTETFPRTGYHYPATALTWDIVNPGGTVIATDSTPNGWNVAPVVSDSLTVTAPTSATVGTNYEVRFSGIMSEDGLSNIQSLKQSKSSSSENTSEKNWLVGRRPNQSTQLQRGHAGRFHKVLTDEGGETPVSKSAYFNVVAANAAPNAPTNLTATPTSSNRINLAWADNSSNEGNFKIYRKLGTGIYGLVATTPANTTTFSDLSLAAEGTYTYKVTASNATGESGYSNEASAITPDQVISTDSETGTDFYFVLPSSFFRPQSGGFVPPGSPSLQITSETGATGLLTTIATGTSVPFSVSAGSSISLNLDESQRLHQNDSVNRNSFRITCDNPIAVTLMDERIYASEATTIYPTNLLGTEYVSTNFTGIPGYEQENGSVISIVATQDNTVITINPKANVATRTAGVPYIVTLQTGDCYQLLSWGSNDLTGTSIYSTKPIGVWSGTDLSFVPNNIQYANPLMEQLLPFQRWKRNFVGIPFSGPATTYYRITAAKRRTGITVVNTTQNTTSNYLLNQGEYLDLDSSDPILVTGSKPIQAMQISRGQGFSTTALCDPNMLTMPSADSPDASRSNWLSNINVPVPPTEGVAEPFFNTLTLIALDNQASLKLNGIEITGWSTLATSGLKFVRLSLSPGNNIVNGNSSSGANTQFLASVTGFRYADAQSYLPSNLNLLNGYVNVTPADPTNLVATTVSSSRIDLTWTDNATNEYGYRLERKTATGSWTFVADLPENTTSYQNTGLTKKTAYSYRVVAYADVDSGYSNTAIATTLDTIPDAPSGLATEVLSDSSIKLTWTDNSDNEASFQIERMKDGTGTWTQVRSERANAVTWTDAFLTKKTGYSYRIKARNTIGDSAWSNVSAATTFDTKPNQPLNLTATATSYSQINLSWTDNSDNEDGFRIERQTAVNTWQTVGATAAGATSFSNTGLTGSTSYSYRVIAFNNGGDSLPSNTAIASTLAPPAPSSPSGLNATGVSATEMRLTWTDNSNVEDEFIIQRAPFGTTNWSEIGRPTLNSASWIDGNLQPNTQYIYRICASNISGLSLWNGPAAGETLDIPIPVSYVAAYATSATSIRVYFDQVSSASTFKVYRATTLAGLNSGTLVATIGKNSSTAVLHYDDSGLSTGQKYFYSVKSVSGSYASNLSPSDYHIPNSSALPLNASPYVLASAILNSINSLSSYMGGEALATLPDGTMLNLNTGQATQATTWWDPIASKMYFPGEEVNTIVTEPITIAQAQRPAHGEGPYHKVFARLPENLDATTISVETNYTLPKTGNNMLLASTESPQVFLGITTSNFESDSGMQFSQAKTIGGNSHPDRWGFFARIHPANVDTDANGYFNRYTSFCTGGVDHSYLDASSGTIGFSVNIKGELNIANRLISFGGYGFEPSSLSGFKQIYCSMARGADSDWSELNQRVVMRGFGVKRVEALVQPGRTSGTAFRPAPPIAGWPSIYLADNSHFNNSAFLGGTVNVNGNSLSWDQLNGSGWTYTDFRNNTTTFTNTSVNGEPALVLNILASP